MAISLNTIIDSIKTLPEESYEDIFIYVNSLKNRSNTNLFSKEISDAALQASHSAATLWFNQLPAIWRQVFCILLGFPERPNFGQIEEIYELATKDMQDLDLRPFKEVDNLEPVSDLSNLKTINCYRTQISSLEPLCKLENLLVVNCSRTSIASLMPLSGLRTLEYVNCSRTKVNALNALHGLTSLRHIKCYHSDISYNEAAAFREQNATCKIEGGVYGNTWIIE